MKARQVIRPSALSTTTCVFMVCRFSSQKNIDIAFFWTFNGRVASMRMNSYSTSLANKFLRPGSANVPSFYQGIFYSLDVRIITFMYSIACYICEQIIQEFLTTCSQCTTLPSVLVSCAWPGRRIPVSLPLLLIVVHFTPVIRRNLGQDTT